jgi:mannonate dehydratase
MPSTAKITGAEVIVTCPGRNFVTLKITTDQGVCGLGDATLNGRELAVASYLQDHLVPCLIGRDAHRIEGHQKNPMALEAEQVLYF